jgi:hypothetical protein
MNVLPPRHQKTLHRKHNIERDKPFYKQGITQYYTENKWLNNTNPYTDKGSQNTTQKTQDWATQTSLQTRDHKTLHRKHEIERHEAFYKQEIYCAKT